MLTTSTCLDSPFSTPCYEPSPLDTLPKPNFTAQPDDNDEENFLANGGLTGGKRKTADSPMEQQEEKRRVVTKVLKDGTNIPVFSPSSVLTPKRTPVADPATHMPISFIEVVRNPRTGKAGLKCPKKWKNLGPLIYMWMSSDGRAYIGRTNDIARRVREYMGYFNRDDGDASQRSLAQAWKSGQSVFVGILHICSSHVSSKQNETAFVVAKDTFRNGHNGNRGEGALPEPDSTDYHFGSPLKDGGGGRLPKKLTAPASPLNHDGMEPITHPLEHTPKKYTKVRKDWEGKFEIELSPRLAQSKRVIYVWKTVAKDGTVKRLVGQTSRPVIQRVNAYINSFNGNGNSSRSALPQAVNSSEEDELEVHFGVLATVSPQQLLEWEAFFMHAKGAHRQDGGYNVRTEVRLSPGHVPTGEIFDPNLSPVNGGSSSSSAPGGARFLPQREVKKRGSYRPRSLFKEDTGESA